MWWIFFSGTFVYIVIRMYLFSNRFFSLLSSSHQFSVVRWFCQHRRWKVDEKCERKTKKISRLNWKKGFKFLSVFFSISCGYFWSLAGSSDILLGYVFDDFLKELIYRMPPFRLFVSFEYFMTSFFARFELIKWKVEYKIVETVISSIGKKLQNRPKNRKQTVLFLLR